MEKKDILLEIIDHYTHGNKRQFAKMVGTTPQNVSTWLSRNTFDADKILTHCEYINPAYLMTGEGDMLLQNAESSKVSPELKGIDVRINELLTISSNLSNQFGEVTNMMKQALSVVERSQQQFDRVLSLFEQLQRKRTTYNIAADEGANTE